MTENQRAKRAQASREDRARRKLLENEGKKAIAKRRKSKAKKKTSKTSDISSTPTKSKKYKLPDALKANLKSLTDYIDQIPLDPLLNGNEKARLIDTCVAAITKLSGVRDTLTGDGREPVKTSTKKKKAKLGPNVTNAADLFKGNRA